ncbi:MAG: precorrin-8X methylmutase [Lachnospiraceae bacterium]
MIKNVLPKDIEARSFEIITEELQDMGIVLEEVNELVIKRAIHTSADFSYAENLVFSEDVVKNSIALFKEGCTIVTDTNMGKSGINKTACAKLGINVECFIADEDVAKMAKEDGTTRATASIVKASKIEGNVVFAIGNAPTALIKIEEMIKAKQLDPKLVIAVPVGFVNVVESKELILDLENTPYIVAKGRKGGSNIAASIVNAILYQATER